MGLPLLLLWARQGATATISLLYHHTTVAIQTIFGSVAKYASWFQLLQIFKGAM